MGMTNRVIPAQGEERGASFTLIWLDGDTSQKFQSQHQQFLLNLPAAPRIGEPAEYEVNSALNGSNVQLLMRAALPRQPLRGREVRLT